MMNPSPRRLRHFNAAVIGAGLSGLTAAAALTAEGARVLVVAKGGSYLHFASGCIDVLGANSSGEPISNPLRGIEALTANNAGHPYVLAGGETLEQGLQLVRRIVADFDYSFEGDVTGALTLPTAIGSIRTTCLAPVTMSAGDVSRTDPMLIVGFRNFRDFYPPYLAANLSTMVPFPVHAHYLDLPRFQGRRHLLSLDVARAFEDRSFRAEVAREVRSNLHGARRIGFPAVLGLERAGQVARHLQEMLGVPIFEIPTLPPSVAGMRLQTMLRKWLTKHGARVEIGFWVRGRIEGGQATEILVESAAHETAYSADAYVLATGGVGGGGIQARADGTLRETVFGLPIKGPSNRSAWFRPEFLGPESQPVSLVGVRTNERLQPVGDGNGPIENVFVTASNLPVWDPTREKSGEGVAVATGYKAASEILSPSSNTVGTVGGSRHPTQGTTETGVRAGRAEG